MQKHGAMMDTKSKDTEYHRVGTHAVGVGYRGRTYLVKEGMSRIKQWREHKRR